MKVEDQEEWKVTGKETGITPLELDTEPADNINDHKVQCDVSIQILKMYCDTYCWMIV